MKVPVRVDLTSRVLEPGGDSRETCHAYSGTWYQQQRSQYLVYDDQGIQTTLRWDDGELRLYRRGDQMEAYQVFRTGDTYEFDLSLMGNSLSMSAHTHHWSATMDESGGEVAISYSLKSGDADLGEFSLSIRMTRLPGADAAPPPPGVAPFRRPPDL